MQQYPLKQSHYRPVGVSDVKRFFNICNEHFQRALFLCIPPSTTHQWSLLYVEVPSARSVFLLCVVCNMMCRMLSLVVFLTGLTPENNMAVCLFLYSSLLVSLTCSLSLKHTRTHSHTHWLLYWVWGHVAFKYGSIFISFPPLMSFPHFF